MIAVAILGTATKLKTIRNIALSGAVKGNANFDGSGNVEISTTQNNIFVLTGKISLSNGTGSTSVSYPTGLNSTNCIPIAVGIDITNTSIFRYYYGINHVCGVTIATDNIAINCYGLDGVGSSKTVDCKILLMKTN